MNGFKNIKIKNFRGIKNLEIDDLGRVNILVGKNNSGKSTVLEAIFLLTGMASADTVQKLNSIRTRTPYSPLNDVHYLFHRMNTAIKPEFFAEDFMGETRTVLLNLTTSEDEQNLESQTNVKNGMPPISDAKIRPNTLKLYIETNIKKYYNSTIFKPDGRIVNKRNTDDYSEKYASVFLTADLWNTYLAVDLTDIFKRKQKSIVLERMTHFDPQITDIDILQDDVYIDYENMIEKLPLRMAGDGMRRYLNIVAASANPTNNIILIDEIDNGLHYSTYKKLWEAIFALATNSDKQIFITTHNAETLKQLAEMLSEHPEYQQEMHLYTIAKTLKKQHQAYLYTYETLSFACENDIEIRGLV
ncbi:MAG: AAA family ATPase [Bacteroidales bacterium]|nr:AAA family ATPase [Bacteroidales bacterium]